MTVDSASNNTAAMTYLEQEFRRRRIPWDRHANHIRCVVSRKTFTVLILPYRCGAHVVNLACGAILKAITNMGFAADDMADNFDPEDNDSSSFNGRDPIACLRKLIRSIRSSSLRLDYLQEAFDVVGTKPLQLIRDVVTRWSSTLLMVDRGILLKEVLKELLDPRFCQCRDLIPLLPTEQEWKLLGVYAEILRVSLTSHLLNNISQVLIFRRFRINSSKGCQQKRLRRCHTLCLRTNQWSLCGSDLQ
jgi:hypothetical protein